MVSQSLLAIDSSLTYRSSRSLGSLGYNAKVDLSPYNFSRLLAIISRVYPKLHVRAAAYTLWGLSRMEIVWDDLLIERKSLANGNNISPLSDGIYKYLKSRVASMKEHEYSVLMYSLGELKLNWNTNLPVIVKEKMFHRLTRVSNFITSRSLANLLYGKHTISLPPTHTHTHTHTHTLTHSLTHPFIPYQGFGKCGVVWSEIPAVSQQAIIDSITVPRSDSSSKKGILMMNSLEIAQTIHALGLMSVNWVTDLDSYVQSMLLDAINNSIHSMSIEGKHATTIGLIAMKLPENVFPNKLKSLIERSVEGVEYLSKEVPSNMIDDVLPSV